MTSRGDSDFLLDCDVGKIRAVSPARAKNLSKLGISTVRGLLENYPRRYIDLSNVETAARAPIGQFVTVVGTVDEVVEKQPRRRLHILEVSVFDGTGVIIATWFRQPWMAAKFERGMRVAFSGKVAFEYGFKRMANPYVAFLGEPGQEQTRLVQMLAVHPATEGISTTWMRRFIANALEQTADMSDPLPVALRLKHKLIGKKAALRQIHFPENRTQMLQARKRLAYEEVLCLQIEMMRLRRAETRDGEPTVHVPGQRMDELRAQLPYTLTSEQEQAIADIVDDMTAPRSMNRMLLGDVGTGKTIVAAFALALSADSGCQAAMMAPTEVLARQYASKLGPLFDAAHISWGILTGATDPEERERLLEEAQDGTLQVLFGTHALIEPTVNFARLSLVIIDEQHRFGVNQRAALRMKGPGCDLLVMTATPIPRTLALTLYGDLETSYIRTRPGNVQPTHTELISRDARGRAYEAIKEALARGRQAYVICPLVGLTRERRAERIEDGSLLASLASGSDISDPKAAEEEAARLQRDVFVGYRVGLLTGRMSAEEKQRAMDAFNVGDIDVLVATTVVEVGVDVPNATMMLIEDAERFGLSQLHQLRGRVGRGEHPGTVFLVADPGKDDVDMRARLDAFVSTTDGFELAEADLRTRHEGDVLGSRQHGAETLKLVNVIDDAQLIACAHADALEILDADPDLVAAEHKALDADIERTFANLDETTSRGA